MKIRCSGESPRCANCKRRRRGCTYSPKRASASATEPVLVEDLQRDGHIHASEVPPSGPGEAQDPQATDQDESKKSPMPKLSRAALDAFKSPSDEIVASLVHQFFELLSPLPSFNFLHKQTVCQRCREETINESLKLALCAITAVFTQTYENQHSHWADISEKLMLERLETPSIFHLQAWLMIIRYRAEAGQFPRAFMSAGLAARTAVALRLNYEHDDLGPVAQECRRRTVWSLYLLEDVFCVGLKEFELVQPDIIHLRLPCDDEDFGAERPVPTAYLQPGKGLEPDVLSSRGIFVKLASFRREIMR